MSKAIGIDLGGSNFRLGHYELSEGLCKLDSAREAVGSDRSPQAIVARIARSVREFDESCPVGVGFAGMLDPASGHIANSPHFGWRDVAFGTLLREALPGRTVTLDNDVNYIALGEYHAGALQGAHSALCVLGGTGIGGALIMNGQVQCGFSGMAGEIGHTKVAFGEQARACHCGKRGCVEAYAGGRSLAERARDELRSHPESLAAEIAGGIERVEASHLDQAAAKGDEYSNRVLDQAASFLGMILANALTILNPSHLLLGGGMLSATPTLRQRSLTAMEAAINPPSLPGLTVVEGKLGDDAGLVGAATSAASARQSAH